MRISLIFRRGILAIAIGQFANAASASVENPSFEADEIDGETRNVTVAFASTMPGWLITRENIDVISYERFGAPDGKAVIDLGGHGPGGIAQTVTGLEAGECYRLSLLYARHQNWNHVDALAGEISIDGKLALSLSRDQSVPAPRWEKVTYDFDAPNAKQ